MEKVAATDWIEAHLSEKAAVARGFSKEDQAGYGIRGANFMRAGKDRAGKRVYHLLDSQCRSHKHVVRSTFAAELRAATAATDDMICMSLTLHELKAPGGPGPAAEARKLLDDGGTSVHTVLCIDGLSVWHSICGAVSKPPAEKTLHVHLRWMRELLDRACCGVSSGWTPAT